MKSSEKVYDACEHLEKAIEPIKEATPDAEGLGILLIGPSREIINNEHNWLFDVAGRLKAGGK